MKRWLLILALLLLAVLSFILLWAYRQPGLLLDFANIRYCMPASLTRLG